MSLADRQDYAADAREDAQRLAQAPAASALLQLSGVLAMRAQAAAAGLAQGNLERLDQRIYACEALGRDLTTAAICEALTVLAGEAGAVRAREEALGLPTVTPTPPEPNRNQHYCQRPPGMACDNVVDCATVAAGDFCDGPEPHLCQSCQGDKK